MAGRRTARTGQRGIDVAHPLLCGAVQAEGLVAGR